MSNPEGIAAPIRWLYLGAGLGFVGLGTAGAFLPIMPSTIFFILALWAFKRSSPRLEQKLLQHPVVGPTLRDWDESRSIKRRTKVISVSLIWLCLAVSTFVVQRTTVTVILMLVGVALTWYLFTRKESDA